MIRSIRPLLALLLALTATGCASRVLRLENNLLTQKNLELEAQFAQCSATTTPADFARVVDADVIRDYMVRAGFTNAQEGPVGLFIAPIEETNTSFDLTVQLFDRQKVLFLAITDYFQLEDATSSPAMVLLLTQLATINYEMLLGKLQLNTRSGEISLSMEIHLDDGLGFQTFFAVVHHLVQVANQTYPELVRAAQGSGIQ